ncbi:hypothetical protein HMPREF3227_01118 [Corynebacterium sp. CMW7794]|nr:hypothetical protein HMPREF0307_00176 [Corynebacterium sp. DNF00584]KXI18296.1 hypothetical protein HMPREF3227_01118 [Corynebacterium sp. CMW7794]
MHAWTLTDPFVAALRTPSRCESAARGAAETLLGVFVALLYRPRHDSLERTAG